jgi:membrane-associated phospholipid phosphatase
VRTPPERREDRRPDDRLLPPLPALTPLVPRLFGILFLGIAFIGMTIAVAAGAFNTLDLQVAQAMHDAWQPSLHSLFQAIAELGGLELTTVLLAGLTFYLWRSGFGSDALVFMVFIAAQVFELYYKLNLAHRQPSRSLLEPDGPSITQLFAGQEVVGNSFPSGHVIRAVIVYGLLAFVIRRLATSQRVRAAAAVLAIAIVAVVCFDRLYLNVHWESDVIGGLLLGAIALLAGTVWLDRPRNMEN